MQKKFTTKEVVIVAMVAAVIGVVYTLLDYAYMPLSAALGTVFMELTFGIYLLSASLPMYIVRKPGFAIFGGLVTAGVNLLLGSPYGLQLVLICRPCRSFTGVGDGGCLCIGKIRGKPERYGAWGNSFRSICVMPRWIGLGVSVGLWHDDCHRGDCSPSV